LNLTYDEALAKCAFNFDLRRYTAAADDLAALQAQLAEQEAAAGAAATREVATAKAAVGPAIYCLPRHRMLFDL
jgi:hypothetical protein